MINFPDNPVVGAAFTHDGTIYTCVAVAPIVWNAAPVAAGIPDAPTGNATYGRKNGAWDAITKDTVGLSNVNNTADADKVVSGPQQSALNTKEPTIAAGTAAQYWRGNKTWATLDKAAVGLGSVDNTPDANKSVYAANYIRNGGAIGGQPITFSWSDDGSQPDYIWGGSSINGKVYYRANLQVGYANTCGTANNSNAVNGISGWAYRNDANNPAYLWCTEGSGSAQHLTQPGNLSVAWANRVGSVEGASGGTLQSDTAVNGNLWSNTGFVRAQSGFRCREAAYGAEGGNVFNFFWNSPSVHTYIDGSYMGALAFQSDERIKHTISDLESDTEGFMALRPVAFRFKDIGIYKDDGKTYHGFIAQNCEAFAPQLITGDTAATQPDGSPQAAGLNTNAILAHTVAQLQKALARIAALEAKA